MAITEAISGDFGKGKLGRRRAESSFSKLEEFAGTRAAKFARGTATVEHSTRIMTEYSETAPLREPCGEGRHYACGSKECSCSCHKTERKPASKKGALAFLGILAFGAIAILFFCLRTTKPSAQATAQLNQQAVKFVTFALVDDIQADLLNRESFIGKTSGENLLDWARLDLKTTASVYEAAYDNNEIAADNEYKGKKILISGSVLRIEKDFTGSGNIWLRGSGLLGIHAQLSDRGTAGAASFSTGQQVDLVCNGSGRLLTVAGLDNCESLSDYMKDLAPSINSSVTDFLNGKMPMRNTRARMITSLYVIGLHLPADSPCMNGDTNRCSAALDRFSKDKAMGQSIKNEATKMMSSLKVN